MSGTQYVTGPDTSRDTKFALNDNQIVTGAGGEQIIVVVAVWYLKKIEVKLIELVTPLLSNDMKEQFVSPDGSILTLLKN